MSLPDPLDFFDGVTGRLGVLPSNVLVFKRSSMNLKNTILSFHHRFVYIIALERHVGIIIERRIHNLSPGQGLMIFPFQCHHYTQVEYTEGHWLFIAFEFDDQEALEPLRHTPLTLSDSAVRHAGKVLSGYIAARAGDQFSAGEVMLHCGMLLHELLVIAHASKALPAPPEIREERMLLVEKVSAYIYNNLSQRIVVDEVAREMALSASHLRFLFRNTVGLSLGRFIRQIRIFKACHYLQSSAMSVTEIAAACGFESLYAFSRTFHSIVEMSPQQYRKQVREKR